MTSDNNPGGMMPDREAVLERLRDVHRRNPSEYAEVCSIIDAVRALFPSSQSGAISRKYPDSGLKEPVHEFQNLAIQMVRETWGKQEDTPKASPPADMVMDSEGLVGMSADIESKRTLKLHFNHEVTGEDRAMIVEAINARRAALGAAPQSPPAPSATCKEILQVRDEPPPVVDAGGLDELRHKLWMIACHATGGGLPEIEGIDRSVNDICVQISAHRNEIYQAGKDAAAEALTQAQARVVELEAGLEHIANYYGPGHRVTEIARTTLSRTGEG